MAARAYWKGQIRLAPVSIPVEIYSATRSGAGIALKQIHEPSGKPIHYEKVVTGIGPIDRDDIIKGYEIFRGNYVLLDEEEIESVKLESKRTLELVQFVDYDETDALYDAKAQAKGKRVLEDVEEPAAKGGNVIDLMAALKASVSSKAQVKEEPPKKLPANKTATKKAAKPAVAEPPRQASARSKRG